MIDASYVKVHFHAAGTVRGDQGTNKRGLNTKIHIAVDSFGIPMKIIITSGTIADSS